MKQGNSLLPVLSNHQSPSSLRRALVAWMAAGALVAVALLAVSGSYLAYHMELDNWHSRLVEDARYMADGADNSVQRMQDPLRWISQLQPDEVRTQTLQILLNQNPTLLEIIRVDASGKVMANAVQDAPMLGPLSIPSPPDWFRTAGSGRTFTGLLQLSSSEASDLLIAVPAPDGGVVAGRFRPSALKLGIPAKDLDPDITGMIITRDGWMLARTDPQFAPHTLSASERAALGEFMRATGPVWEASFPSPNGENVMVAASPVSGTDWMAITQIPHRRILETSLSPLATMAINTLVLGLLLMLFARHALTQLVFQPIEILRRGVERLGLGDWDYRLPLSQRDELGVVAETLNQMAERLRERDQQILASTQAMRQSETRLLRITDSMQDIIAEIDSAGKILYVSPSDLKVLGYSADTLVGQSILEHMHPDDRGAALAALTQMVQTRTVLPPGIFRYQHADGHYLWLECVGNLLSDPQGQLVGIVICSRDVTRRREMEVALRDSEARYRAIVEDQTELICRSRPDGTLTFVNGAYCRYFGKTREEMIGQSFFPLIPDQDRSQVLAYQAQLSQSNPVATYEHRVILPDGSLRWQQWTDRALFDPQGQLAEYTSVGRDITERKLAEVALRKHNEYLSALYEIAMALMERLQVKDVLQTIVESAAKLVDTPDGFLYLEGSDATVIETVVRLGIHSQHIGNRMQKGEGLAGKVWESGQAIVISDYDGWEGRSPTFPAGQFHAAVAVPLYSGSQVVGVLGLSYREAGRTFGEYEVEMLTGFAQFASIALDNARLYAAAQQELAERKRTQEALARRGEYLNALAQVQRILLVDDASENLYDKILPTLGRASDAAQAYVFENQRDSTGRLQMIRHAHWAAQGTRSGMDEPALEGFPYDECFPEWTVILQRGEIINACVSDAPESERRLLQAQGILSVLILPLMVEGEFFGYIGFDNREVSRPWEKAEVDLLTAASGAIAQAIQRRRAQAALVNLNQELEQRVVERTSELRHSEERFRAIMESAKDAIVSADGSGKIIQWNRAAQAMYGYTAAEALGQSALMLVSDQMRDRMQNTMMEWSQSGDSTLHRTFEGMGLRRNGEEFPVEMSIAGWRSEGEWFASSIARDITDRKRAEETLARSERLFRSLIENAWDITAIEDANAAFTYVSPSVERVVGFKPSEVIGQSILSFVHPDDWLKVQELFARSATGGETPMAPPLVRARHKDGTWRAVEAVAMNCLDDPAIAGIVTNIRDVTERMQAEERLLHNERRFRALVENSWDLVALLDANGILHYASPSATSVAGYLPDELVGHSAFEFMPADEVYFVRKVFDSLVQQPGETVTLTTRLLHHDGQYRWADLMAKNLLLDPTIQAVVVHIHDITDRKLAELQAQKRDAQLNALSQMGLAVTMSLDLDVVLAKIAKELMPLLEGAEGISILLREGDELYFAAIQGSGTDTLPGFRMPWDAGVAGTVMRTGQAQRVMTEIEENKIYRGVEGVTGYHTQSLLAVPLKLTNETIGVLEAVHRDPSAFSEDDLYLLESAAKWASIAIGNARNYQDLKRRLEEGQALSIIGQALNETLDLENVLQLITHAAQQIIPSVEKAVIHLYDDKRKALYPVAATGSIKQDRGTLNMRLGEGIAGRVMEQAETINVADIQKDPRYLLADGGSSPRSLLVAPIQSRGQRSGTISIESAVPGAFSPEDESLLTRLGTLASIAINNAGLYHGEREQRALAEALRETASALGSTLDYDAVLDSILDNVGRVIKYDLAAILLIEQATGFVKVVRCLASDPKLAETVRDFRMHVTQIPNFQTILRTGNSQVIPDVKAWPEWVDVPATRWIASHIGIPIRLRDQIVGFLNLESTTPGFYADEHIARLQSFAAQAATALGNAKLYQELQDALEHEQTTRSQLIQSGKLAALGRMAASVAHEFNNPLQTIKNCLYLLQPQCAETEDGEFMGIAISETERLSRLVEQLRSAYRPELPEDMRPQPLRSILEHTCALIMPHLKENRVGYEFNLPPGGLFVTGVADQLKQVFLNIALNAVDAMKPGGGKLTITAQVDSLARKVGVAVADTGRGIPPQDLPHLFDPFFTTKETGMGLGLAITFDIVQKHNGQIEVGSVLGQGSTFTVWLPLKEA